MAKINWTVEAENWLKQIHAYIAQDNPKTANQVVTDIYRKTQFLERFPEGMFEFELH